MRRKATSRHPATPLSDCRLPITDHQPPPHFSFQHSTFCFCLASARSASHSAPLRMPKPLARRHRSRTRSGQKADAGAARRPHAGSPRFRLSTPARIGRSIRPRLRSRTQRANRFASAVGRVCAPPARSGFQATSASESVRLWRSRLFLFRQFGNLVFAYFNRLFGLDAAQPRRPAIQPRLAFFIRISSICCLKNSGPLIVVKFRRSQTGSNFNSCFRWIS